MVTIFLCLLGRALNIYPLTFFVNKYRKTQIDGKMQFIMFFSGLRGAIAFALALNVPSAHSNLMVTTTLAVVLFTIIVFGGGTLPLLSILQPQENAMAVVEKVQMSKSGNFGKPVKNNATTSEVKEEGDTDFNWFDRLDAEYLRPFLCTSEPHDHSDQDLIEDDEHCGGAHAQDPDQNRAAQELMAMSLGASKRGVSFHRVGTHESHVVDGSIEDDEIADLPG